MINGRKLSGYGQLLCENPCSCPFSGFTAISNIEVSLVALTVFPFLNFHIPAFCKVKNIVSNAMPVEAQKKGSEDLPEMPRA